MKKRILIALLSFVLVLTLVFPVSAATLDPPVFPDPEYPYVGVLSSGAGLSRLDNGKAKVAAHINLDTGYHANATLSLYREGYTSPVTSWYQSSSYVVITQSYSVTSGYTYYLILSASIYDSNNNYVDSVNVESNHMYF